MTRIKQKLEKRRYLAQYRSHTGFKITVENRACTSFYRKGTLLLCNDSHIFFPFQFGNFHQLFSQTRQIPGVEVVVDVQVIYSAHSPIFSDRTEYGWIYSGYQNPCHRYSKTQAFFLLTRPRIINQIKNQSWKLLNRQNELNSV